MVHNYSRLTPNSPITGYPASVLRDILLVLSIEPIIHASLTVMQGPHCRQNLIPWQAEKVFFLGHQQPLDQLP